MSLILDLRDRKSHAGTLLIHPTSENVVLANVFGIVKNISLDAILNPWLSNVTHNKINVSDDWHFSFWEKQPRPVGVREGSTEVDLVLDSQTTLVFVEVKMDADASSGTTHDPERNQLIRNLDVGYKRATVAEQAFTVVYITPDIKDRDIVDHIRSTECSFPLNPETDPRQISECLFWSSWSTIGDIVAQSYKDKKLNGVEQRFSRDLLAYLAKKRLWENTLPDEQIFHDDKLYRPLAPNDSPFTPYSKKRTERDESWRAVVWDKEALVRLLNSLRWQDKLLLKIMAESDGIMRQDQIMRAIPFLRGKSSGSLRALKNHVNAACKGCGKAPILAVGSGAGDQRVHQINPILGELRQVVINTAKGFEIPESLLDE